MRYALGLVLLAACSFDNELATTASGPDAAAATVDAPSVDVPVGTPWLAGWAKRKPITLLASQIEAPADGTLADFPVVINVTDAQIAAGALANGNDIVFTASDAVTPLAAEIESFSKTTNELVAWVKLPMLSATTDTTIFVYYGNAAPPARNVDAVWTNGFAGVWHMQQDPGPGGAGDIKDATSGNRDGTAQPNMQTLNLVPAQVGPGILFDGFEDFINYGALNVGNAFTISMWIRYSDHLSCNSLFANSGSERDTDGMRLFVNSANSTNRRLVFETGNGTGGSGQIAESANNAIPLDTFAHVAAVVDRTAASARLYVNGQMVATDTSIINDFRTDSDFEFGRMENGFLHFLGVLDEVEIATVQRSPEWLTTAYRNQLQPSLFHTLGIEQLAP